MGNDIGGAMQAEQRRLAAIMFTDIVGFSRQMGADEARMLRLLDVHNRIVQHAVVEHHGTVIKTVGDAFLVDFPSVVHAVQCAQQIQSQFRPHNTEKEKADQIHVRIGIHLGDIVQKDGDVFGDGVNIASRLQASAEPDTICISQAVYKEVEKKLSLGTVVSLGKPKLKNIAERFAVYALLSAPPTGVQQKLQVQKFKLKQWRRTLQIVAVVLLVGAGALVRHLYRPAEGLPLPDKPSIVVLPFVNMSEDPNQAYLGDGIAEDITTDLSKLSELFVISRSSAFTYKGKKVKVQEVSRELGVRYVLEGSVRRANDQVRVTAQLIDATTGYHLWSERYDRLLTDIFALQDEIVRKLVLHLALKLTDREREPLERSYAINPEAYEYRVRGIDLWMRLTKDDNTTARQLCEKAMVLEPTYAQAYTCTGWTYLTEWAALWTQDPQALDRAFELGQKALVLDGSLPPAHELLGSVYLLKRQFAQAIAELEQSLALAPSWGSSYAGIGRALNATGRTTEAIGMLEKAIRLNPRNPFFTSNYLAVLGDSYRLTGQYDRAIATFQKSLDMNRNLTAALGLASVYSEVGREGEAKAIVAKIGQANPQISVAGLRSRLLYQDPAVADRYLAALQKAGLK